MALAVCAERCYNILGKIKVGGLSQHSVNTMADDPFSKREKRTATIDIYLRAVRPAAAASFFRRPRCIGMRIIDVIFILTVDTINIFVYRLTT
jgi:hypothetical protein